MAEIIAIITASLAAIEQSISLFDKIVAAVNSVKDLPNVVGRHTKDLNAVKDLLAIIKNEKALQTLAVGTAAENVDTVVRRLQDRLKKIQRRSEAGKTTRVRAFFSASEDKNSLDSLMKELDEAKARLIANLLVVNVGLNQGVNKTLQVNTATLNKVNDLLREKLGDSVGSLKLAERIEGRPVDAQGMVELSPEDIKFLRDNAPDGDYSDSALAPTISGQRAKKVVRGNISTDSAWMQNVPVSEVDEWRDCDVFITNNTAEGTSVMQNYPLPTTVLLKMFEIKAKEEEYTRIPGFGFARRLFTVRKDSKLVE